jgi:hypothetical protein
LRKKRSITPRAAGTEEPERFDIIEFDPDEEDEANEDGEDAEE